MTTELFREQARRIRAGLVRDLGCDDEALDSHALVVVPLPPDHPDKRIALLAVTLGTGTVVSAESRLIPLIEADVPPKHYRAMRPYYLERIAGQGSTATERLSAHGHSLGFALAVLPEQAGARPGLELVQFGPDWMARYRAAGGFDNALGEPDEPNLTPIAAFALVEPGGEPVAIAGIHDERHQRWEIGLDVVRSRRGRGLARPVVIAATRRILEQGQVPIYTCGATNVRSHRTALSCGYLPYWTVAALFREPRTAAGGP